VGTTVHDPAQLPSHLAADEHHADWAGRVGGQSRNRQCWRRSPAQAVLAVFTGTRWIRVAYVDMRDWTRIAVDTLEAPGWSFAVDLENKTS
jgi:hypothetical protein